MNNPVSKNTSNINLTDNTPAKIQDRSSVNTNKLSIPKMNNSLSKDKMSRNSTIHNMSQMITEAEKPESEVKNSINIIRYFKRLLKN